MYQILIFLLTISFRLFPAIDYQCKEAIAYIFAKSSKSSKNKICIDRYESNTLKFIFDNTLSFQTGSSQFSQNFLNSSDFNTSLKELLIPPLRNDYRFNIEGYADGQRNAATTVKINNITFSSQTPIIKVSMDDINIALDEMMNEENNDEILANKARDLKDKFSSKSGEIILYWGLNNSSFSLEDQFTSLYRNFILAKQRAKNLNDALDLNASIFAHPSPMLEKNQIDCPGRRMVSLEIYPNNSSKEIHNLEFGSETVLSDLSQLSQLVQKNKTNQEYQITSEALHIEGMISYLKKYATSFFNIKSENSVGDLIKKFDEKNSENDIKSKLIEHITKQLNNDTCISIQDEREKLQNDYALQIGFPLYDLLSNLNNIYKENQKYGLPIFIDSKQNYLFLNKNNKNQTILTSTGKTSEMINPFDDFFKLKISDLSIETIYEKSLIDTINPMTRTHLEPIQKLNA